MREKEEEIDSLRETVRSECEERLALLEALNEQRGASGLGPVSFADVQAGRLGSGQGSGSGSREGSAMRGARLGTGRAGAADKGGRSYVREGGESGEPQGLGKKKRSGLARRGQ